MDRKEQIISSLRKLRIMLEDKMSNPESALNKMLEEQKKALIKEYDSLLKEDDDRFKDIWSVIKSESIADYKKEDEKDLIIKSHDKDDRKQGEELDDDDDDDDDIILSKQGQMEGLLDLEPIVNFKSQIDDDLAREEFEQVLGKMEDVSLLDKKSQIRLVNLKRESKPPITITNQDGSTFTIPYAESDDDDVDDDDDDEKEDNDLGVRNDPEENLDFAERYRNMKSVKLLVEKLNELVYAKRQWTMEKIVYWLSGANTLYPESIYDKSLSETVKPSKRDEQEQESYMVDLIYEKIDYATESVKREKNEDSDSDSDSESDEEDKKDEDGDIVLKDKQLTPLIRIEEQSMVYSVGYDILDVICHKSNDWLSANRFLKENYYEENTFVNMSEPIYETRSKRETMREHLCIDVLQHWLDFDRWLVYGTSPMDEPNYNERLHQVPIKRYRMVIDVKELTMRIDITFRYLNEQVVFEDEQEIQAIQSGQMKLEPKPLAKVLTSQEIREKISSQPETVICHLHNSPWSEFRPFMIVYIRSEDKFVFENKETKERSLVLSTGPIKLKKMAKLLDKMMDQWIVEEKKAEALEEKKQDDQDDQDDQDEESDGDTIDLELKHKDKKQKKTIDI